MVLVYVIALESTICTRVEHQIDSGFTIRIRIESLIFTQLAVFVLRITTDKSIKPKHAVPVDSRFTI